MVGRRGERVGKAIADVQPGAVAAAAEAAEGVDGDVRISRRDGDDVEATVTEETFKVRPAGLALAALDDERKLDPCHRREQANRSFAEGLGETCGVRLLEQDGDEGLDQMFA